MCSFLMSFVCLMNHKPWVCFDREKQLIACGRDLFDGYFY